MIEIHLSGDDALQYLQNEKLQDEKYTNILDSYNALLKDHTELQRKYDTLISVRETHTEIAKEHRYKKPSPFETTDVRADWENLVRAGVPIPVRNTNWSSRDTQILKLAVGKRSPEIYSVTALAKYLGRSKSAVIAKANSLGFNIKKDMIINQL